MSRIVIACGGTGGHLAPGIAVAEILQERGHECLLLISQKQVDSELIGKYGHLTFVKTPGRAFAGGVRSWIPSLYSLVRGWLFSRRLMRERRPDVVLAFGGFLSMGLSVAARLSGVPVVLHEANCRPGRATRLIRHFAERVYLPEGVRLRGVPPERIRYYGYPVRREIRHCLKADAWRRLGIKVPRKLLVVIGGSQGAASLNDWVADRFAELARAGISVYCVSGLGKRAEGTVSATGRDGETYTATFTPFSNNMGDVISAADLVVSRAGAGSIAEIIRCRAPAILVPYPYAADDHQTVNARMHEQHGAGVVVPQEALDRLTREVTELMFNDWLLSKFKANLARLDRVDAGERIATDIEGICATRSLSDPEELEATA